MRAYRRVKCSIPRPVRRSTISDKPMVSALLNSRVAILVARANAVDRVDVPPIQRRRMLTVPRAKLDVCRYRRAAIRTQ